MPGLPLAENCPAARPAASDFSTAKMAAFSRVTKAATRSQLLMLRAVVPKKWHRQNAEAATGWPRGGLAQPNVKTAAFFEGAADRIRSNPRSRRPRGRLHRFQEVLRSLPDRLNPNISQVAVDKMLVSSSTAAT